MTKGRASAADLWRAAAADSTLWRAVAPVRRAAAALDRTVARVTMPAAAAADRDRRAEAVFASSGLVAAVDRVVDGLSRAWRDSLVRRRGGALIDPVVRAPLEARLRLIGSIVVVASVTALALRPLTARPDPFTWIVPAASLAVGALAAAGARAIAAATERRT